MSSSTAADWSEPDAAHAGEVRKLSTLLEASQALSGPPDLKAGLHRVLEILGRHHGAIRSTVVLIGADAGDVDLEVSAGDTHTRRHPRSRRGESITEQVLQSGKPLVIPRIGADSAFSHRTGERPDLEPELSYISAPISLEGRVVGAVGIDLLYNADRDYHRT